MIYCLTGKIVKKSLNAVVLSCGGVGYYTQCPASVAGALPGVGQETTLYTVMSVTENDVSLYGFATEEQQACFEMLTAVSGVGPKVGLAILSVMEPQRVALAISAGDHKAFKAASGVGPKPVSYTHLDVYKRQEQRHGAHHQLQLRCPQTGPREKNHQAGSLLCRVHHAHWFLHLPVRTG